MKHMIFILVSFFGVQAFASGLGPAGCGLGHQIFGKENQILAATTNGSSYSQFIGITIGTSGCEKANGVAKLETFINGNRVALAKDISRGHGETLAGMAQILHCDAGQMGTALKGNYMSLFPAADTPAATIGENIIRVLNTEKVTCTTAG